MKILTFILSLMVMTLSLVPCSDALNDCEAAENSHTHKEDHNDFCTPFCTCYCCGANVVLSDFSFHKVSDPVYIPINGKVNSHYPSFIPGFYGNIWQPPKI